ncbi:MAG: DUF763 domain-containing protein [Candidatus Aenigmarchaeota archaeon]|nr:DUF763 domain-containing protein [Candidatus Aenigmarchaeota archaeon]
MRTGIANLPLHYGSAPPWLFQRMAKLAREITVFVVSEFGASEMLLKLSDPFWFQSFGCVLGFDWHSSGLTTTTCGALKEGIKGLEKDLGLFIAGGKGATSRKTPSQIESNRFLAQNKALELVYASKMSAKVDNTAVQDGYQLYHHSFIFTSKGDWTVVQQGMNDLNRMARRYHWHYSKVQSSPDASVGIPTLRREKIEDQKGDDYEELDFVDEPHSGIITTKRAKTLNLVAHESEKSREVITEISKEKVEKNIGQVKRILNLAPHHQVNTKDLNPNSLKRILLKTYTSQPQNFEKLLGIYGVGPKTIRSLALISELIYGAKPSFRDPAKFSFAHGGKDGYPYPVDRKNYDKSIEILKEAVIKAKIGEKEKVEAIKRLAYIK